MSLLFLAFSGLASTSQATLLPSIPGGGPVTGRWWAQVGDRVVYAPPASLASLSQNVSDYYYFMGSKSALTPAMDKHVVASQGRWHIMHLPQGPSMLEVSAKSRRGGRRSSLSSLVQLESGAVLSEGFPQYKLNSEYVHPLNEDEQKLEKETVASITPDTAMDYLKHLTDTSAFPTRSYSNLTASSKVEEYLKQQFEGMGLHTCYQSFKSKNEGSSMGYNTEGAPMTNIVAHIPGSSKQGAVIVGAHYDSRPFSGNAPGAVDNGSGVASMLAIAKAFMQSKAVPKKSVFFVAFGGEEVGLVGSVHFADAIAKRSLPSKCTATSFLQRRQGILRSEKKVSMADYDAIIMDETGWLSKNLKTSYDKPTVNLESFDDNKEMMDHLRHSSQTHNGDKMDVVHNGNPFGSDHMSFSDRGMHSALTIMGDDESYPHYHKHSDSIENVNPDLMMMITKMNLGAVMRMSMA